MKELSDIHEVLNRHLHDPGSSFSIGSFGAIAEFHRDWDEPLTLDDSEGLTIATGRGALRVELSEAVTPLAYETLSGRAGRWQHGVVFCLDQALASSNSRTRVTELGPDRNAVRPEDRDAVLFDMGLGARNIDFCVRTADPRLLDLLRQGCGCSIFEAGNPVMAAIIEESPHRIALSKLGRAEVYQAIDKVKTPQGPHTHVLPKFLKSGRTHSANIPVPARLLPCLSLHPANPLYDGNGCPRPFDPGSVAAFRSLLDRWGHEVYLGEKERIEAALAGAAEPEAYTFPKTRLGRTALRVTLRQVRQSDPDNDLIERWLRFFDRPESRTRNTLA